MCKEDLDNLFDIVNNKLLGWEDKDGYRYISINGKLYQEHRLIFLYYKGYLPDLVDHIDRNPRNNHIDNLRAATN